MKNLFKILCVFLVLFVAFSMFSCTENEELREQTTQMLDALIDNNFNDAYNLVSGITTKEQFQSVYAQMTDYIDGVTEYELSQVGINSKIQNGITLVSATYLMKTNAKTYMVESQVRSDVEGLYGFHILESQIANDGLKSGTITTMKGADAAQWIFLIVGLLEIAFVIVVFVDAAKQKFNKKPLWLALILLGTFAITINLSASGINFNFSAIISLINNTAFIKYATGASSIRIMVPIFAIVYLIKRKNLINSYNSNNESNVQNSDDENFSILSEANVEENSEETFTENNIETNE